MLGLLLTIAAGLVQLTLALDPSCLALRPADRYQCQDGTCIPKQHTCDATKHCSNGEDEIQCETVTPDDVRRRGGDVTVPCTSDDVYACQDGTCVHGNRTCDGVGDCTNAEDESPGVCGCLENEYKCNNVTCIDRVKLCDQNMDCDNGEDEQNCETHTCPGTHGKCSNHYCIPHDLYCNHRDDCGDNSDELNCDYRKCHYGEFQCDNYQCITEAFICDGVSDCFDNSDEKNCASHILCNDTGLYRTNRERCDGWATCAAFLEDENQCGACRDGEYRCTLGRCISQANVCDGVCDCGQPCDDEKKCDVSLKLCRQELGLYQCRHSTRCIHQMYLCDSNNDCRTRDPGIDEKKCSNAVRDSDCPTYRPHFACQDGSGRCLPVEAKCDFIPDCMNGLDERDCDFPACGPDEYRCRSGQCIPDSQRCDTQFNCHDRSDEDKCGTHTCPSGTRRCRGGQCLAHDKWCDFIDDCLDGGDEANCAKRECRPDEFRCHSGQCVPRTYQCLYTPKDGQRRACADGSHLWNCRDYACPEELFKCRNSYCIETSRFCDGTIDCTLTREDETRPECVHRCPPDDYACECRDVNATCVGRNLTDIPPNFQIDKSYRTFLLQNNYIGLTLSRTTFTNYSRIAYLDLSSNHISHIPTGTFEPLRHLHTLKLADNKISKLTKGVFFGLAITKTLDLSGNGILEVGPKAFLGLRALSVLDLSDQRLTRITAQTFVGLRQLKKLDLSSNDITEIEPGAFYGLGALHLLDLSDNSLQEVESDHSLAGMNSLQTLDLSENELDTVHAEAFLHIPNLQKLVTDEYRFCCVPRAPQAQCLPGPDEFSSCEDLMANYVLRVCLWVIGIVAFVGNIVVIVWRLLVSRDAKTVQVHSFLITNLAISDLMIGGYLLIIAAADFHYRGVYILYDKRWRASTLCRAAGFLSTLSSELSVGTLTLITIDRLISIIFPFKIKNLDVKSAKLAMFIMWLVVILISALPLFPISYFDNFYGRSGVCLALHITPDRVSGWEYSVFVFIGINLVSFLIIFVSYLWMFVVAKRTQNAVRTSEMKRAMKKQSMGRRMTLIVATDFFCWIPICLLGIASLAGANIPPQVYAWIAVFVLPVNGAINPVLYTLSTVPFIKHAWIRAERFGQSIKSERWTTKTSFVGEDSTSMPAGSRRGIPLAELRLNDDTSPKRHQRNSQGHGAIPETSVLLATP